ncbi:hypothetical protein TWF696_000543 [Orbilia brochopaga]|uniref:Apple domain-containing protein n=1 Tax=Orbilia brochopaga TaxID=3140254 RepID=A0AAV9VCU1_9PEZI
MKSTAFAGTLALLFQAASALPSYDIHKRSLFPRDQAADNDAAFALFTPSYQMWGYSSIKTGNANQYASVVGTPDCKICAKNCDMNDSCNFWSLEIQNFTVSGPLYYTCTMFYGDVRLGDLAVSDSTRYSVGYRYASTVPTVPSYSWKCYGSYSILNSYTTIGTRTAADEAGCKAQCDSHRESKGDGPGGCVAFNYLTSWERDIAGTGPFISKGAVCVLYKEVPSDDTAINHNITIHRTETVGDHEVQVRYLRAKDQSCLYTLDNAPTSQ